MNADALVAVQVLCIVQQVVFCANRRVRLVCKACSDENALHPGLYAEFCDAMLAKAVLAPNPGKFNEYLMRHPAPSVRTKTIVTRLLGRCVPSTPVDLMKRAIADSPAWAQVEVERLLWSDEEVADFAKAFDASVGAPESEDDERPTFLNVLDAPRVPRREEVLDVLRCDASAHDLTLYGTVHAVIRGRFDWDIRGGGSTAGVMASVMERKDSAPHVVELAAWAFAWLLLRDNGISYYFQIREFLLNRCGTDSDKIQRVARAIHACYSTRREWSIDWDTLFTVTPFEAVSTPDDRPTLLRTLRGAPFQAFVQELMKKGGPPAVVWWCASDGYREYDSRRQYEDLCLATGVAA